WYSVTYANGLFVAVSYDGTNQVMTSPDGINWTARTAAAASTWRSITYGNGLFVAVATGGTNRVMTSPDGITWTARTAAEANQWYSVVYGNGLFIAVTNTGTNRVMTSPISRDATPALRVVGNSYNDGNLTVTGDSIFTGLVTANGGLTVQAGGTFTMNGDAFTDLTGAGLTISGGALTVDSTVLDDNFFIQNGNSFGVTAVLGTNDANSLVLETNNQAALTIANGGAVTLQNNTNSASAFRINTSGTRALLNVDTTNGLTTVSSPIFQTVTNTSCGVNCTITQTNVDQNSGIIVEATSPSLDITLPDPTNATAGRVVYITAANGSDDFTLVVNGGGQGNEIAMRQNTTATMIWNGADWTAAGASSSTTLQAAYDNTLTSAGGAEIVLSEPGGNADGLTIRNNPNVPVNGGVLEVQSAIGTNLLSVNNFAQEYADNGGAESSTSFAAAWTSIGSSATISRNTVTSNLATGQGSVQVTTSGGGSDKGVRNNLTTPLATNTQYMVSFTGKLASGTFTTLEVVYSRNGGASIVACDNVSGNTLVTTGWSKITCTITTDGTAASNADLIIRQTDTTGRTFYIDNLSIVENSATSEPDNVQIGGGIYGGPVTLFTLDRASSPPVADGNQDYLGSMYYDTVTGRIQCYEADGWGACGSAPNNYVNLNPEYPGSVLNGSGVGTMTADFCADGGGLSVNTSFCASGEARNYYAWASPQATEQTYSIYITYQLPAEFGGFDSNDSVQLTARTDSIVNGEVSYEMFRNEGGAIVACGSETVVTSTANTWQTVGINGNEATGCGFSETSADNFVIFKINMKARSNAAVYASTLSFTTIGQ
ncbi:MAG: beta strand repeat-containing protein, partial [Anaerorhabdus sp.]|uniref:beta strand repeat-containing protein n=1 Tax=Anaerorhabdus sp. TaxID=1872524 RepID=UPI003A8A81AF